MRLLLISNSTLDGEEYLDYPKYEIQKFIGSGIKKTLFIPYAGVTMTYDEYAAKVENRFREIGLTVDSIHLKKNPVKAVEDADAIVIGGGNTFELINQMHKTRLITPIRKKVLDGTPFVGWSAGSNVACPTVKTTNDMPIVEPPSFSGLALIKFQINPHYLDANPDGHAGETREQRINEFLVLNTETTVVGLREGTMLRVEGNKMDLIGKHSARIFKYKEAGVEIEPGGDLSFLLK